MALFTTQEEQMPNIILLNPCPNRLVTKAKQLLANMDESQNRSRKIASLKAWRSLRLAQGYRLLYCQDRDAYLANHDTYERQISALKRAGH